jgi:iron complex transport system substrate-binding protein
MAAVSPRVTRRSGAPAASPERGRVEPSEGAGDGLRLRPAGTSARQTRRRWGPATRQLTMLIVAMVMLATVGPADRWFTAIAGHGVVQDGGVAGAPARRIVSLVPAATEMLFAMGAGDRLVGVSTYDRFPPEVTRIPQVGGLLDPNIERVLSLRADLVILYSSQTELRRQLERAHLRMFEYTHRGLADVTETIRSLGKTVGDATRANAAADGIERQLAAIRQRVALRKRPRTLLVFGREPGTLRQVEASGGYGFLHDLLELAGADDVLGDIARESVQMSTEMILARAPEVIIELHYGRSLTPSALALERQVWDVLPGIPAVRQKQVHLLMGDEFVVPGPRIVLAAERFARTLHPDAF